MNIAVATRPFASSIKRLFSPKEDEIFEIANYRNFREYDLIVFSGGADINPKIYGEENTDSYFNVERDKIEISVFMSAQKYDIPVFGICRGHQLINALLGGRLIQDLNKNGIRHGGFHRIEIEKEDSIIGETFTEVNSIHHQGVIFPGYGLDITSSYEGVIESTEGKKVISVQWHPEFMLDKQSYNLVEKIREWVKKEKEINEKPTNI